VGCRAAGGVEGLGAVDTSGGGGERRGEGRGGFEGDGSVGEGEGGIGEVADGGAGLDAILDAGGSSGFFVVVISDVVTVCS
jgi:hypothetical protein